MVSRTRSIAITTRSIAILALCASAPFAAASPSSDPTSGRATFTGASVENATTLELNPAALGLGTQNEIFAAASAVIDQIAIHRRTLDVATGALSDGARLHDTEAGSGAAVGIIWHALDRVTLGLSFTSVPSEEFVSDQPALGYHSLGGYQRNVRFATGFGFKVNTRFQFGFSVAFDNAHLALHYLRDSALANGQGANGIDSACGSAPCGVENPAAAERYDIDVNQAVSFKGGYVVNFGLVVQLLDGVWLGAAYHSPPGGSVQTELTGTAVVTGAPRDGGVISNGNASVFVSYPASVDAELRARLLPDLDLHVGGRWVDLTRLYAYDVRIYGVEFADKGYPEWTMRPRGLHDTFALWGGVEQVDTGFERIRLGGRLGIETSGTTPSRTSPMAILPTSVTADLGAQLRVSPKIQLQLTYGLQYYPTVHVTSSGYDPRAQLDCIATGYDYSTPACASVRAGYAIPTADGDYGKFEHALRLGVRYSFK